MTQIQVEIISVNEVNKGKYNMLEVAFRQDGKVQGKNLVSYVHEDVYALAKNFKEGEVYNVVLEKENGYWQWVQVSLADTEVGKVTQTSSRVSGQKTVSNYETKEERAVKQQYIIRQSALDRAVEFMKLHGKKATLEEVFEVAQKFVDWVNQG